MTFQCSRNARPQKERWGSLIVLLLAERARSEGARSTRAFQDRPGRPLERKGSERGGIICRLARRLPPEQHWRQAYRETNLTYPETGEHLILHFQKIGATFHQEATQQVEAA
jgi:hypothetical protein